MSLRLEFKSYIHHLIYIDEETQLFNMKFTGGKALKAINVKWIKKLF